MKKIEYVDLGLPSGTLWAKHNSHIGKKKYFTYYEAIISFGDRMPTKEHFEELINSCTWEWKEFFGGAVKGYKVTGPNGNSIFLSITGYFNGTNIYGSEIDGYYWSTTRSTSYSAYCLDFYRDDHFISKYRYSYGHSVRLIKRKTV